MFILPKDVPKLLTIFVETVFDPVPEKILIEGFIAKIEVAAKIEISDRITVN
jgi:hypothetical protein